MLAFMMLLVGIGILAFQGTTSDDSLSSIEERQIQLLVINDYARHMEWLRFCSSVENNDTFLGPCSVEDNSARIIEDVNTIFAGLQPPLRFIITTQITMSNGDHWTLPENENGQVDGLEYLRIFHAWRHEHISPLYPNDNGQLFSGLQFQNNNGGFAGTGTMCNDKLSGGINVIPMDNHFIAVVTVAHELGHNLGMDHDSADCVPKRNNVMSRSSTSAVQLSEMTFSDCSQNSLRKNLKYFTCVTTGSE
jgi:hypothetical protein